MYRTDIYFLCKTTADLPVYIFFPFLFVAIPYYAIGLNPDVGRFFIACGIVILLANVATSFGKKTPQKLMLSQDHLFIILGCRLPDLMPDQFHPSCISFRPTIYHPVAAFWRFLSP